MGLMILESPVVCSQPTVIMLVGVLTPVDLGEFKSLLGAESPEAFQPNRPDLPHRGELDDPERWDGLS